MRKEVSSLELRHLVSELQSIVGSRIDKIYQPDPKTFVFALRKTGEKKLLRIEIPKFFYLTSHKEEMPDKLTGFCGFLRKYIEGLEVISLSQVSSERVVKFELASKEEQFQLFIEFFSKGNMIISDADGTILNCLEPMVSKDRLVKPGVAYELPERPSVFTLTFDTFSKLLDGENISTALATQLGLGGLLAQELCALAGVSPNAKQATADEAKKLFVAWQNLLTHKLTPLLVLNKEVPEDVLAFPMRMFEKSTVVPLKSLSEGIDRLFTAAFVAKPAPVKDSPATKLVKIISMQESNAVRLEKDADAEQKKGEFIYENYQTVKTLLDELQSQMKHHSLQEIQEKLKGHKVVKEINPKEGTVTVEF